MIDARAHAKAMWESGDYTMRDIAVACGREMSCLREWRREDGWRTATALVRLGPELREQALALLDEGYTPSAIARELLVSRTTVRRWRDDRPSALWRCDCSPYGVRTAEPHCPACGRRSPL